MKTSYRAGFSLVETMVAVVSASIAVLTIGGILTLTYRGWERGVALADMENDAALAVHALDIAARGAVIAATNSATTDFLRLGTVSNGVVRVFSVTTSGGRRSLVYTSGGSGTTVVNGRLGTFSPTVTGNVVRVSMTLTALDKSGRDTGVTLSLSNLCFMMRN